MNHLTWAALASAISRDYSNIAGLAVLQNGTSIYEKSFHGYTDGTAFHVFSVTKSVLSVLIGIAIDKGLIKSLDQRVLDFFPDYTPKRGEKTAQLVTLRDMMTMTTPYKYKSAPYTKYFSSEDWVKSALDLLGGKGAIGDFRYTPLIGPDILSGILTRVTGQSVLEFAKVNLFAPLGIRVSERIVFASKEEQLAIMKDHHESGWVADPQGVNTAGWGLFLRAGEMSRIGQLLLNRGVWDGRRIVPSEWIDESTAVQSRWGELMYGYLWWIIDAEERSFAALGDGGNAIYVNPAKDLVVAIASLFKPTAKDRIEFIKRYIEAELEG